VVTQKPGGTGSPTEISSPRLAPFPPPRSRSFRRSVSSGTTSLCGGASKRLSTTGFSVSSCSPRSYISVGSVHMGVASVPGSFSPQAAVYQRETTANRAGLLIQFPLPNPRVRLRAFEKNSTGSRQELRPPVHDERYGVPDMDVYISRLEGRKMRSSSRGRRGSAPGLQRRSRRLWRDMVEVSRSGAVRSRIFRHKIQQNTAHIARITVNVAICRAFWRSILRLVSPADGPLPTAVPSTDRLSTARKSAV
jgi:hypothetical protein